MENKQIITLAYELAKTRYKNKPFTFEQLWTDLIKKAKLDKDEQQIVGHVYTCMLQDHRFIFIGNHEWKVREFLTEAEQIDLAHKLYDFKQEQEEEKQRLATQRSKENDSQLDYRDEDELEESYKETKEKLMHDEGEDDDDQTEESEPEIDEEDDGAE